jgi:outer membrane biosynthesis protein TonB
MANVTVKNTTISSPAAPVYFSTTAVDYNTTDGVTTPQLTLVDCEYTLRNPDKNAEVVHNPQGLAIDDNPEIANGFQGFEKPEIVVTLPEAPETSAVPETTPVPETSAVPETTPAPETTEAPTTNAPTTNAPTEAPITTTAKPDTTTAPTNNENKGGGCGGFTVAASFLAVICAAGAAIVIKKK